MTGLFLALILLGAAVPAVLDCCFRGPQQHGAQNAAYSRQIPVLPDDAFRGCVDHAGPTQSPYIETSTGAGAAPASARGADSAATPYADRPAAATRAARHSALDADSTGPPLWLSTCVSRT
ncbi:MAG TPA: hypothetical protein VFN97_19020 [Actinospica sp.]|nr:hypothetical protein [Actinospica sp.]